MLQCVSRCIFCAAQVRLVVVDSIALPFQLFFDDDFSRRSRTLAAIARDLARIAHSHPAAVSATA